MPTLFHPTPFNQAPHNHVRILYDSSFMLRPIGKQRVGEEIANQLRSLILRGEYAVGDKLPPERKLAEELGVNRASLREAIKSLEQMGLVKTRQGDGTRVLDFMQTAGAELLSHLLPAEGPADPSVLADVMEFRRWFGREVARLAALRASEEDLARLTEIVERGMAISDASEMIKLDFEFYVALAQSAKNRVLQLLINTIRGIIINLASFFASFNPPPSAVRQHQEKLLEALRAHDAERAAILADQHLGWAADRLEGAAPQG